MSERNDSRATPRPLPEVSRDVAMLSRFAPRHDYSVGGDSGVGGGARAKEPSVARVRYRDNRRQVRGRSFCVIGLVSLCFVVLGAQLVSLAIKGQSVVQSSMTRPLATAYARPDIVDRKGRLLATDVALPSLYADPALVIDRDELVQTLKTILPDINERRVLDGLRDKRKRFMWIRRGLSPRLAQKVFDAGFPGLSFRSELKRAYPMGGLAGHLVGAVDVDNKGLSGIERYLDRRQLVEPVHGVSGASGLPVRLSLDVGAQHALEEELSGALSRYKALAASGVVLDVDTGEIVAAASLPGVDPMEPAQWNLSSRRDRLTRGAFELGSVFKLVTVAMALELKVARPDTMVDVRAPLEADGHRIVDPHASTRPISVSDVFIRSSNVGAGVLALETGAARHKAFLARLGLLGKMETEAGPVAPPRAPSSWGRIESVTVSYGHGIAVAPLQFAAGAAALVNGGVRVKPTLLRGGGRDGLASGAKRVVSARTSKQIRAMMRLNVTDPRGTGRRADVAGYRVGGKTGTAEMPGRGGYKSSSVISSFFAAFPMDKPRYVVLVSLFEPKPTRASGGKITADRNAAPVAGAVIARLGPLLGVKAVFE